MPKPGVSAAIGAMLAVTVAFGTAGCMLPVLGIIPSVISLAHSIYTSNSGPQTAALDAEAKNQEALEPTVGDDNTVGGSTSASTPSKPSPVNLCQMMAVTNPNMVLVELRKNGAGAPEYRELHLLNSADEAHWTPVVDRGTGTDGWQPAVNFLRMDFKPSLTAAIPDSGSCYLAYAPSTIDPNDANGIAQLKSRLGNEVGTFSWAGRVYEYTVALTPPCVSPSS
jgi:hypothetical protein